MTSRACHRGGNVHVFFGLDLEMYGWFLDIYGMYIYNGITWYMYGICMYLVGALPSPLKSMSSLG